MSHITIAPSILGADFRNLEREFEKINNSAAEWIHFDVMDGINVPNISFGFPILEAVKKMTDKVIDVHLMIENPSLYLETFAKKGANHISIHFENNQNLVRDLKTIKDLGISCGLVVNPNTEISLIEEYLTTVDVLLIMSVQPGFGGQSFITATFEKVKEAKKMIAKTNSKCKIQVDGGVSISNSKELIEAGADILVCGSALFNASHFNEYVNELKG
jgi:ribulose-phosphate 3-epimerase